MRLDTLDMTSSVVLELEEAAAFDRVVWDSVASREGPAFLLWPPSSRFSSSRSFLLCVCVSLEAVLYCAVDEKGRRSKGRMEQPWASPERANDRKAVNNGILPLIGDQDGVRTLQKKSGRKGRPGGQWLQSSYL